MRKVKLYIAMSWDGYIADANGGIDFLHEYDDSVDREGTYDDFMKDIDTVLLGWTTYYQLVTELSSNQWMYEDCQSYVFTHRQQGSTDNIIFTDASVKQIVDQLRRVEGKDIWVCGGTEIVQQALEADLIDEFYISVIPKILGEGIRLFKHLTTEHALQLTDTVTTGDIVELRYTRK
ncbi:dihydrofolate reductase family protein [Alloscardovia criceti]|uniref:dihydrofolate reductase family protein n=1 Tax=Alloscardovia criceti TaxID=356828 RepID=UPI0003620517|nr:dihydrofolate reductase family protein [Alloscardovia criceti]